MMYAHSGSGNAGRISDYQAAGKPMIGLIDPEKAPGYWVVYNTKPTWWDDQVAYVAWLQKFSSDIASNLPWWSLEQCHADETQMRMHRRLAKYSRWGEMQSSSSKDKDAASRAQFWAEKAEGHETAVKEIQAEQEAGS
jgi:hypothetical protein